MDQRDRDPAFLAPSFLTLTQCHAHTNFLKNNYVESNRAKLAGTVVAYPLERTRPQNGKNRTRLETTTVVINKT